MQNNIEPHMAPRSKVFGRIHLQDCYNKKRGYLLSKKKKKRGTAFPTRGFTLLFFLIFTAT